MQRYLQSDSTFDPDTIRVLGDALDRAWRSLQTTGVYFTSRGHAEATQEKLALRIIEMAKHGERDPDRLRDDALEHLAQTTPEPSRRRYTGL
jgi:hypothetical protein